MTLLSDLQAAAHTISRERHISAENLGGEAPLEQVITLYGDYGLTVAYAALFAPDISLADGIPTLRFAPGHDGLPADVVHVDLLHHGGAAFRSCSEVIRATGGALAYFWTIALRQADLPGEFIFEGDPQPNVIYRNHEAT